MGEMAVGERIKARRKELGLSAEEVAVNIGVSPATVYRYESAAIMNMKTDKLLPIAEALQTTPEFLMGWTDDPENHEYSNAMKTSILNVDEDYLSLVELDLLKWTTPLIDAYAKATKPTQENVCKLLDISYVAPETVPEPTKISMIVYDDPAAAGVPLYADSEYEHIDFPEDEVPHDADFGIRIRGNSMEPTIEDGAIVWVHKTADVSNGHIGVFMIDDTAVCKRIYKQGRIISLVSDNEDYEPITVHDFERFGIVGKVLEYR